MLGHYSMPMLQEEARYLVGRGFVSRQQPIYTILSHIPVREWPQVERELEAHSYLLRERIGDLVGREDWSDD